MTSVISGVAEKHLFLPALEWYSKATHRWNCSVWRDCAMTSWLGEDVCGVLMGSLWVAELLNNAHFPSVCLAQQSYTLAPSSHAERTVKTDVVTL